MRKILEFVLFFSWMCLSTVFGVLVLDTSNVFILLLIFFVPALLLQFICKKISQNSPKARKELQIEFYNECLNNGIKNISSVSNKQKAELIAQRLGCKKQRNFEKYFEESKKLSLQRDKQDEIEAQKTELENLRNAEQQIYTVLTKYASFRGRDKRVAMLTDAQKEYFEKAAEFKRRSESLLAAGKQPESDWALLGGIASGIAGGAAGIAVASDIQSKNAEIRAKNDATKKAVAPFAIQHWDKANELNKAANELQSVIDDAKIKLVADIPQKVVFEKLKVEVREVNISKTGAFTIKAFVKLNQNFTIFDDIPAVVDGSISADLYQEGHKVGSALLVLPAFGIGKSAVIEGICLKGAKENSPYKISFTPHLLWAMEE